MRFHIQHWTRGPYSLLSDDGSALTKNEPVPHKWLPGDTVDEAGKVLKRRPIQKLVGIVNFVNRTGYGFSPRGIALYMFHPLQKSYPPFLVASKIKYTENYLAAVSFEHWEDKWPRGGIQTLLGTVGSKTVERNAILQSVQAGGEYEYTLGAEQMYDYDDTPWDYVFNIDPDGCQDVDDVFAWRTRGEIQEFAIAIADVAAWVAEGSDLDNTAYERGTTFYDDGVAVAPMLPEALSAQAASLRADGVARPVVALVYTIVGTEVSTGAFRRCRMTVSKAYTYESIMEDKHTYFTLLAFLQETLNTSIDRDDSHVWVELAMVEYNRQAARILRDAEVGFLRSHAGTPAASWNALAAATGCREVAFFGYAAGTYIHSTVADARHAGLNLDVYTHASSPLRRYADLYNQRWLAALCCGGTRPVIARSPIVLNGRTALAKAFDRDMWFLKNLDTTGITTVSGWALVDKGDGIWSVYVPIWKRRVRAAAAAGSVVLAGMAVVVRAYTDLKATSMDRRVVCSITHVTGSM